MGAGVGEDEVMLSLNCSGGYATTATNPGASLLSPAGREAEASPMKPPRLRKNNSKRSARPMSSSIWVARFVHTLYESPVWGAHHYWLAEPGPRPSSAVIPRTPANGRSTRAGSW